jgi:AGCS family alanine or glycine:cation symporter
MKPSPLSSLFLLALLLPALTAQDPVFRRQPEEPDWQAKVDLVFGDIIDVMSYLPFADVAGYVGLSQEPHRLTDQQGTPTIVRHPLESPIALTRARLSPAGDLVLGFDGDTALLWSLAPGSAEPVNLSGHTAAITAAGFFADGGELTTGDANGGIRIWNPDGSLVAERSAQSGAIRSVAYSPDGTWLATGSADGTVVLWDATCAVAITLRDHQGGAVDIAFAPDEEHLATRDGDGTVRVWRTDGVNIATLEGRTAQQFTPDAQNLVTQDAEGNLSIVAIDDSRETPVNTGAEGPLIRVSLAGEGEALEITALLGDGTVKTFGADGSETSSGSHPVLTAADLSSLASGGGNFAFAGDGDRLVKTSDEGIAVWEWFVRGPDDKVVKTNMPAVVMWLLIAMVLFTLFMRFVNLRMFRHAIAVVCGKYSNPNDKGEVSNFQALSSALSATVGLGNIAGVAIAVSIGGPGATFWMIIAGLLGMTVKFTECTLGQKFRKIDEDGRVSGGPMHYLRDGLSQKGLAYVGVPLAMIFSVCCIGGSLAGGNSFQVNQSLTILKEQVPFFADYGWVYGLVMASLVGIVIIGGIRRIAQTAARIVPTMCSIYVLAAAIIVISHSDQVPGAIGAIVGSALTGDAVYGGAIGALITGIRRAAFSNEAGIGSAAIAMSAARTAYPVRTGLVALLEPFIDTVVVCTMTALVIIITGVYDADRFPQFAEFVVGDQGAALTSVAFATVFPWFPWVLMVAVILFAYSTMISWSYYGERCWTNLFGPASSIYYKLLFMAFVVLGSVVTATKMLEFGDLMILLMAFPNIFGLYFLVGLVKRDLKEYEDKLKAGDMPTYK